MNFSEMWAAITYNAAIALNLKNQGALCVGEKPRFSFFKCKKIEDITYNWGKNFATWI